MATRVKTFSEHELLEKFKLLLSDFKVTLQDIKNPTPEFVNEVYRRILLEFDVDISSLMQPNFDQRSHIMAYEEMFQELIPIINLMKAVNSFEIINLEITDLVNSGPKRNLQQMSMFMQFVEYCDVKLCELNNKIEIIREMKKRQQNLKQGIDELKERKNNQILQRCNMKEEKMKLEQIFFQMKQEQKGILNEKDMIKEKMEEVKCIINEKNHSVTRLEKQLDEIEEEIAKAKSQIVVSPTSILTDVDTLRKKKEDNGEMLEVMKDKLQSKKQKTVKLTEELDRQEERMLHLMELIELINSTQAKKKDVEAEKKTLDKIDTKVKEVNETCKKLKVKMEVLKKEFSDFESQWEADKSALDENIESSKRDRREVELKAKEAENMKKNLECIELKIQEKIEEFHSIQEDFKRKNDSLMEEVKKRSENVIETLKTTDTKLKKLIKTN